MLFSQSVRLLATNILAVATVSAQDGSSEITVGNSVTTGASVNQESSSDDEGQAEHAFVLLGPTGDNSLRTNGVWQGLFESWCGGLYDSNTILVHPIMNTPHTEDELQEKVLASLEPLYASLQENPGWECKEISKDCEPQIFYDKFVTGNINIQDGRDADKQAKSMIPAMEPYTTISVYLSVPPYTFGDWASATATNLGSDRVVVAAEKPFGESTENANELYEAITGGGEILPADHLLLVDHWVSFFMIKNLPAFQKVVMDCLDVEWNSESFSKIVVTQTEERGLEGRGGFFDGVGQVRDMIQSHLLQTLGLLIIDPDTDDRPSAKLDVFEHLSVVDCTHGQYDSFLFEPNLGHHDDFADATFSTMILNMKMEDWKDTSLEIATGKFMGLNQYTISMYEADGPGVLTFDIGAEELGVVDIKVSNWASAKDECSSLVPAPGFNDMNVMEMISSVDTDGNGMIVSYDTSKLYFPTPYAVMIGSMVREDYSKGFVTWPECNESWNVVTAGDSSICLDPPGAVTRIYTPPGSCGNNPPEVCYTGDTVQDYYDTEFACTSDNDVKWNCVNFYQDKCGLDWNPPECDDWTAPVPDWISGDSDSLDSSDDVSGPGGCKGGNTFGYGGFPAGGDDCSCVSTICTAVSCVEDMGGTWDQSCPACDPEECDPLAADPNDDPSCVGAPEMIDRFGKKMYRRKVLEAYKTHDDPVTGTFCFLKLELCDDESQVTQGVDSGFGDYYRIAATPEWYNYTGTDDYKYSGMNGGEGARSYSPVTPLGDNNAQFIIKQETSGDGIEYDCTPGENCKFGFSELACMVQEGDELLLSKNTDHAGYVSTHLAYTPNFSREPGNGPYTINMIGQGVALTELNVLAISELMEPFNEDGGFSNIGTINYLWANSYWDSAKWIWDDSLPESDDLARQMIRDMAKWGIRFNLMHSISRESRPEAQYPRTNVTVIGEAFGLANTTDQDPNIKWVVVGSSNYKRAIYPQILEWGFDMQPCPGAESKGYPYCGTNALYGQAEGGTDPNARERSEIFKFYQDDEVDSDSSSDSGSGSEDSGDGSMTIAEMACSDDDFTILCSILQSCASTMDSNSYTVFAPTDDAFKALDKAVGGLENVPQDTVCAILMFHVVSGGQVIYSDDLNCEGGEASLVEMANGINARIKCSSPDRLPYGIKGGGNDEVVNFIQVDLVASDGVVHVIDGVLLNPGIMGGNDVKPSFRGFPGPM